MVEGPAQPAALAIDTKSLSAGANTTAPPTSIAMPPNMASRLRNQLALDTYASPVNQNGSFEFDRVLKSGYLQKRTQKTKVRVARVVGRCNASHDIVGR
jgi:hypothetical protein